MSNPNLVVVQTFTGQPEAALAKSALENAGIDAIIQADAAGGVRPRLAWAAGGYKIMVREDKAASARDVLECLEEEELAEEDEL